MKNRPSKTIRKACAQLAGCAAVASIGLLAWSAAPAAKGTSTSYIPASMTFQDRTGDHLYDDGKGVYQDGVAGVQCGINTQEFFLNLSNRPTPLRAFGGVYAPSADLDPAAPGGNFNDGWWLRVNNIGTMFVSATGQATAAGLMHGSTWRFRYDGSVSNVQLVLAQRTSRTTWIVTADPSPSPLVLGDLAGDVAVMEQSVKNNYVAVGRYHMPFQIVVNCPTCTCQAGDSECTP